jgi:hypothetical protein
VRRDDLLLSRSREIQDTPAADIPDNSSYLVEYLVEIGKIVYLETEQKANVGSKDLGCQCRNNAEARSTNHAKGKDPACDSIDPGIHQPPGVPKTRQSAVKIDPAARATTVLKQCNKLGYAPRILVHQPKWLNESSHGSVSYQKLTCLPLLRRDKPKRVVGSVASYRYQQMHRVDCGTRSCGA